MDIFKSATSQSKFFELVDSTTGLPKTGIVFSDVTGSYSRTRGARVAITMATLASASAAYSSGGFILVDDTNQPGVYRLDVPDGAFATGADEVVVTLKATGCRTVSRSFSLVDINKQVAYAPNAAAGAVNGLLIAPTTANTGLANVTQLLGTAWLTPEVAGTPDVNTKTVSNDAITSGALATSAAAELAALIEAYIINEGDATAVLQAIADKIAADWVAGDASPLAVASAVWANGTRTLTGGVTLADAVTHGGSSAKLQLGSNSSTPALLVENTHAADNSHAAWFKGTQGAGMVVDGGGSFLILGSPGTGGFYAGGIEFNSLASQTSVNDLPTNAELATALGTADDATLAAIAAEAVKTAAIKLKTDLIPAAPAAVSDIPTAAVIADAVWDEPRTGHTTAGTFGFYVDAAISGVSGGGGDCGNAEQVTVLAVQTAVGELQTAVTALQTTVTSISGRLSGSRLSVSGAVTPGGDIILVVGSDYVDDIDSSLTRSISDPEQTLYDKLINDQDQLVFSAAQKAEADDAEKITGTITDVSESDGVTSIVIAIERADIPSGKYNDEWLYQIWRETDDHVSPPLLEGNLTLQWRS